MSLIKATESCSAIIDRGRFVQATRPDGLKVFFEKEDDPLSLWLNTVRAEGDRRSVILAVGFARGLQIAMSYAAQHGDAQDSEYVRRQIEELIENRLLTIQ